MREKDNRPKKVVESVDAPVRSLDGYVRTCRARNTPISKSLADSIAEQLRADAVGFLRRQGLPDHIVEDLAQVAVTCAFRGLDRFRGDSTLQTWMNRIALNCLLRYRKIGYVDREVTFTGIIGKSHDGEDVDFGDVLDRMRTAAVGRSEPMARSPEEQVIERDEIRRVESAMTQEQRVVVHLVRQGYSYLEIAKMQGLTEGIVRGRLHRAKQILSRLNREDLPI